MRPSAMSSAARARSAAARRAFSSESPSGGQLTSMWTRNSTLDLHRVRATTTRRRRPAGDSRYDNDLQTLPTSEVRMARIAIEMPRLGYDMEQGKVSGWLKKVGDSITRGDVIAE